MLGGWSAEGSERYSRAAKHKIATMQKAVSQSFTSSDLDPLAEADDIDALGVFLKSWEVPDQEILRVKTLLVDRSFTDVQRDDTTEVLGSQVELAPDELIPDEDFWNRGRSELLGDDHKQTKILLRAELEPGYYISFSGKKAIKVLHRLGQCYMLPGEDYMSYQFAGSVLPEADTYDTVCKWCAKGMADQNSSGTDTSSLSEEGM